MARQILHIDFDSFFASVEQQDNPLFRNKPVGVTAANGRTCIIASSREAKQLGIKTGTRTYDAKKICPSILLVSSNFVKYFEVSKKFLNICKDYSPFVELFSIDELFMDITKTFHLFGGAYGIIQKIKQRIKDEIGAYVTVSVGISHNKLLAKLASGFKKPDGIFEIGKNDIDRVYGKAELTDVCGIGERIKTRLNVIGIYNLIQLKDCSLTLLVEEFGDCEGNFLKNVGLGIDDSSVMPYTITPSIKSVSRNYCLPKNEYDKRIIMQNLYELCEEIGIKLRRLNKKARTVGCSLRGSDNFNGRKTYQRYFDTGKEIFDTCLSIIDEKCHFGDSSTGGDSRIPNGNKRFWASQNDERNYVRQISVWVSGLEDAINTPLSLFDPPLADSLQKTVDKINERFGDHTIRNGFLLYADKLTTVPNGYMADKYERIKLSCESNF